MSFNTSKCKVLQITNKRKVEDLYQYTLNGKILDAVKDHPYLGIELTSNLSWSNHVDKISSSASKTLNMLRRNFHRFPIGVKKQAYTALVRPTMEYASSCWDPYEQTHIDKLERIQNRAARFIKSNYNWRYSVSTLKSELELETLQRRRFIARNSMFYKALRNETAIEIPFGEEVHHLPVHMDTYKYSFLPRTARCWNILPQEIRNAPSTESFKRVLVNAFDSGYLKLVNPRGIYCRPTYGNRPRFEGNYVY